jgi:hypothetical protein
MSVIATRTTVRGRPSRARGPARVSKKAGQIWADAPLDYDEQARTVRICPTFDYVTQVSTGVAATKNIWFGPLGASFEEIVGNATSINPATGRFVMVTGSTATHGCGVIVNGGGAAGSGEGLNGFRQVTGQTIRCGMRFKVDTVASSSLYFGLQSDASGISAPARGYWFEWVSGTAVAFKMANASGTQTIGSGGTIQLNDVNGNPAAAPAADTYMDAGFVLTGSEIDIYWNGGRTSVAAPTNLFTSDVYLFWAIVTAAASTRQLTIERVGATRTVA